MFTQHQCMVFTKTNTSIKKCKKFEIHDITDILDSKFKSYII